MKRTLEMNVLEAAEKGTVFVCQTQAQIDTIIAKAQELRVVIEHPILISHYRELRTAAELN